MGQVNADTPEWERPPHLLVTVTPYTMLVVLAVFTTIMNHSDGGSPVIDLGLCGLTAAWMLTMFTLRPSRWEQPRPMGVFLAGLVVLTALLVLREPTFGFFTAAPYIFAFSVIRWPQRLAYVAATAVVAGIAQSSSVDKSSAGGLAIAVIIVLLNLGLMGGVAWFLRMTEKERGERARAHRLLQETLAENAALHQRLLVQAREAGVLDERRRMAREIHDTLAQGLTGIITQLQAAEQLHEVPQEWRRPFEAVKGLARESLTEARRSVHALRPESLETARLSEALADVAGRWSTVNGVTVQVTTTGAVRPLTPEAEFAMLRTAQEALANVAKHGHATRVGVTLSYLEGTVALDVRDDGRGFDPAVLTDRGFGLTIMRQRVEALSGDLRIESEPGAGTGISASLPLPAGSHR